jgi:hypothetical protein
MVSGGGRSVHTMAMADPGERFTGVEQPHDLMRAAEERCLEAEQRCFRAERRRFEAERRREQAEALLAEARKAGIKMEQIVAELKGLAAHLRGYGGDAAAGYGDGAGETVHVRSAEPANAPVPGPGDSREQMVDALSSAIARLRANVQAVEAVPRTAQPAAWPTVRPTVVASAAAPPQRAAHKHSASWISRWRARRKQRR